MDEARAIGPRRLWLLSGILILLLAVGGLLLFLSATSAHASSPQKGCSEKGVQTSVKGDDGPSSAICINGKQVVNKGATTCIYIKDAQGKGTTTCKPGGEPPIGKPGDIKGTIACKTFQDSKGKVTTTCTCSGVPKTSTKGGDGKTFGTQGCGCAGGQPTTVKNDKGKITVNCGEPGKKLPLPDKS